VTGRKAPKSSKSLQVFCDFADASCDLGINYPSAYNTAAVGISGAEMPS
jgi:hypothetical protein